MTDTRNVKIVADSSSDIRSLEEVPFSSAALKIITAGKEYVDDEKLDVVSMVNELLESTEKTSTACPSVGDWLDAFGGADEVYCVTITSNLSGSYNSAMLAKAEYEQEKPGRKVCVIDSLSTGPEMKLIMEKIQEFLKRGFSFEDICSKVREYQEKTGLLFMLESMKNLANNGRVSKLAASAAGLLSIRVVGKASDEGTLEPLSKCRGTKKAIPAMAEFMKKFGYKGGKVRIAHCCNEGAAQNLKAIILEQFARAQIEIYRCGGLCSFYAEKGGLIVGFEK